MSVCYSVVFYDHVLPMLRNHFKEKESLVYDKVEMHTLFFFKNHLVAIVNGDIESEPITDLFWIDDMKITTDISIQISDLQFKAHKAMIKREQDCAERIWQRLREAK